MQWIPGLPSPSPLRRPGDEANACHTWQLLMTGKLIIYNIIIYKLSTGLWCNKFLNIEQVYYCDLQLATWTWLPLARGPQRWDSS